MTRSFQAAIASLALFAIPAIAGAETLSVSYPTTELASSAGRQAIAVRIEAAADAYCRANPKAGATVARCRQTLTTELAKVLDTRAQQYAQTQTTVQLARR